MTDPAATGQSAVRPPDQTDPRHGLTMAEVARRQAEFGPNSLPPSAGPGLLSLIGRQARSFVVLLLLVAAALSALLGQVADALAILGALILNAAVGVTMDLRAENAIAALQQLTAPTARIRRDGLEAVIPAAEVVPGDILLIQAGDRIAADGRLLIGSCLIDESLITGESVPVTKAAVAQDTASAGTLVAVGHATVQVTATGAASAIGRVGELLAGTVRPEPLLTRRLDVLGRYLAWTISAVASVLVAVGLLKGVPFWPLLRTAVALAIAAIPEGLPAVATLVLAIAARRLVRAGVLVRRSTAIETLAAVTTICLDKTGTLTANAMTARRVTVAGADLRVSGDGWTPVGDFAPADAPDGRDGPVDPRHSPPLIALVTSGQWCNEATLETDEHGWHIHGDPTEGALLVLAAKAGLPADRPEALRTEAASSDHPWMLTLSRQDSGYVASIKGAAEAVLARCGTQLTTGGVVPLTEADRAAWLRVTEDMAGDALRVLGLARKQDTLAPDAGAWLDDWQWLGLVGLADPPRPESRAVLAQAHAAGIRTIMITGDHPRTALAIARELDLADGREPRLAVGTEAMDPATDVYARARPAGKLALVQALAAAGAVVAMTGDGVNDAPALQAASVGIAMGGGADVAKESADLILTDERLATILTAVAEGRTVFRNLQHGIDYLLTCSAATMLTVLLATVTALPLPLTPLQILYLNLLTHTFPALGLALEPSDPAILQGPPVRADAPLLNANRQAGILWHGLLFAATTLGIGSWGLAHADVGHGRTLVFTTLACVLLVHTLTDRSARPFGGWRFGNNPLLFGFLLLSVIMQAMALFLPPLRHLLGLGPVMGLDWAVIAAGVAVATVAAELSKRALPPDKA